MTSHRTRISAGTYALQRKLIHDDQRKITKQPHNSFLSSLGCTASMDLTTHLYRPLLPGGLPGYILYWHRAVVNRF